MLLTRYGRREWLAALVAAALVAAVGAWLGWWALVAGAAVGWLAVALFFRDPARRVPADLPRGAMLSPADGVVNAVERLDHHDVTGGPAVVVRVFLSILDVHLNRAPGDGEVVGLDHRPGRYHDARSPLCPTENESQLIAVRLDAGPTIGVRQIAGKVARRIVCDLEVGSRLARGARFGMIKFGSSTELILPAGAEIHVAVGDRVRGGLTLMAKLDEERDEGTKGPRD